ncbi:MAG: 16S rRNA (uracil(1498)-N(3))-methyltransferase [Actinomycetales bacterium]|nr:16S rRNA (uracil(1498)-N(3))-methyltransferase [Actinomycetales bacterium]
MVEPLFRANLSQQPEIGEVVSLDGAEAKHAISVRRMRIGEAIQITDGQGLRVRGEVTSIAERSLALVVKSTERESLPSTRFVLVQALAKGDRDELAIQAATELGAWAIWPWQAERSVSRWDAAKAVKGVDRWQAIVTEAAKQSLRVFEPRVTTPVTTKELASRVGEFDQVLVLDPTASVGLGSVNLDSVGSGPRVPGVGEVAIVVGPEGGISETELNQLEAAGAKRVRLGHEILRTSTAGVAAISALQARLGAWD